LRKLDAADSRYSAIILAYAGLARLGWHARISQLLDEDGDGRGVLHAVGQGALAVEIRAGDEVTQHMVAPLTHAATALRCAAERAFMRELEGGCSVPIGVFTRLDDAATATTSGRPTLLLRGCVTSEDGVRQVVGEDSAELPQPATATAAVQATPEAVAMAEALGARLARRLLPLGAADILADIRAATAGAPAPLAPPPAPAAAV
ncbi:porphobilinogen deaminase, partial [Cladochytrium tenue]